MNQRYHVVINPGKVTTRRPWVRGLEKYAPNGKVDESGKLIVPAMFGAHEIKQSLEPLGDFIIISIDNKQPNVAENILNDGYPVIDPDSGIKSHWYVAGWYVRDTGVVYICTPTGMTDEQFFQHRKLHVNVGGRPENCWKVGKYLKRYYSHQDYYTEGVVINTHVSGNVVDVKLPDGNVITVKYADHGALTDGINLISSRCAKILTGKSLPGQGFQNTYLGPQFSKGLTIELPWLKYDLVLFNSKALLSGDTFTIGMKELHGGGAVYSDLQSYLSYRQNQQEFLLKWSISFMGTVVDAVNDNEKLRTMLEFYKLNRHMEMDPVSGEMEFVNKEEDWTLGLAMDHGVDIQRHPALVRRFYNLFTKTVAKCEELRVPISTDTGQARYACVDPFIFDEWGDPTLEGDLHGNTVYCGKSEDVVFHRQPNGHRNEHHIATAVHSDRMQTLDTETFMFISRDVVMDVLYKLGGGDQDDRVIIYFDQDVVKHFRNLELDPYPVVPKDTTQVERRVNTFADKSVSTTTYNRKQLKIMLAQMKLQSMTIGYVVNAIMQDTCITDHKQELMDFVGKLPPSAKHRAAMDWITDFKGNVCRESASRLEDFIDSVKKAGSADSTQGLDVSEFNKSYMVVPEFLIHGGFMNRGRVPASRRNESHPVIARCSIDDEIDKVKQVRRDLEDQVTDNSYKKMGPVPEEILTYPTHEPAAEQLAIAIQSVYADQRKKRAGENPLVIYQQTDELLFKMFGSHPLILEALVNLYRRVYEKLQPEAPVNKDGSLKKFADGILWGNKMANLTVQMLEMVGLAGRYVPVTFAPGYKHLKRQKLDVVIEDIGTGESIVKLAGTHEIVGTSLMMAEGSTTVEKGLVFVKPASQDVYPYDPDNPTKQSWISLSVVNGWKSKLASGKQTGEDLSHWKQQAHKKVQFVPYVYVNGRNEDEHAVRIMLDGQEYGHISREDAQYVTKVSDGWLVPSDDKEHPYTMKVITVE